MSFRSILDEVVQGCGAVGAALMGADGIPIEQVAAPAAAAGPRAEDIGTAGTEFGRVLEEMRKASDAVSGGALQEATVALSRLTLVFRVVDEDTFLVVALPPDGNLGKARYLMRRQLLALRREL